MINFTPAGEKRIDNPPRILKNALACPTLGRVEIRTMTAKVIRIPEFREREVGTSEDTGAEPAAGWDPYEVWRTRVLQPRLEEPRPEESVQRQPIKRSLFDWLRRNRAG